MASPYGEDIAVLKDQMKDVKDALTRIEAKQDAAINTFATKAELKTFKWITVPLVIILSTVLTALVIYYLSHGKTLEPSTTVTNSNTSAPASGATPASSSSTTSTSNTAPTTPTSNSGGLLNNLPLGAGH